MEYQLEIKKGGLIVRVSGTTSKEVMEALEDAFEIFKSAQRKIEEQEVDQQASELKDLEYMPTLKNPETIRDAISQLMAAKWGKTPRTLSEIVAALETNAVYYTKSSISNALRRMTQSGLLRRFSSPKGYKYVSNISPRDSRQ